MYEQVLKILILELKNADWVSLTCDNWQSYNQTDYLGSTSQFCDQKFLLKARVLCLKYCMESKTASYLLNQLNKINSSVNST